MNIIILGAPGAGKSIQSKLISTTYSIPHISIGDILRQNVIDNTDIGIIVRSYLEKGDLVPDNIPIAIITDRLSRTDNGFVLDGFPRNITEVYALDIILDEFDLKLDIVIHIDVDDEELIRRLLARKRLDDRPETIINRFIIYKRETEPVIDYYRNKGILRTVDGRKSIEQIFEDIQKLIS